MRPGQVRDLAGNLPCEVFSRPSPATRRSQVRCRSMFPAAGVLTSLNRKSEPRIPSPESRILHCFHKKLLNEEVLEHVSAKHVQELS